jgi:type IV pilus assembly protein PilN
MIRINLLPFRAARKRENVKRQLTVYILTVTLLIVGTLYVTFIYLNPQLSKCTVDKQKVESELKVQDKILREISELENGIKEVRQKLDVIKELEKNKTGPVRLLEEIARSVPRDKLWLISMNEAKGKLTLQGTAMDNETVALFMTNLEKSEYIKSVDLDSTKLTNLAKFRLNVSDFVLSCKTYAYKEEQPPAAKKETKASTTRRAAPPKKK